MSFDLDYQSSKATPSGATGGEQQQEVPAGENPEPIMESGPYPGSVPGFFPYTQYPALIWQPRVDIFENHDNFLVIVEVPGVSPEQLNVENAANLLLISGHRPLMNSGGASMIPRYQERLCGSFSREIPLPPHASLDQAEAACKNGLLEIKIPKKQSPSGPTGSAVGEERQTETKTLKRRTSGQPSAKH